ncbi:MAG: DNRLRE domain-containing protein [Myxococcota bacterium]|nr:DNRLRE domain-containing protein [Myxococcota bacterium]
MASLRTAVIVVVMGCGPGPDLPQERSLSRGLDVSASFQEGVSPEATYAGTRDTFLDERAVTTNFGGSDAVIVDGDDSAGGGGDKPKLGLVGWVVSTVPPDATVTAVTLVLTVSEPSFEQFTVHRMIRPWTEDQATWEQPATGASWEIFGAAGSTDRSPEEFARFEPSVLGAQIVPLNAAGVAAVQGWVSDPSTNRGLAFLTSPVVGDGFEFRSREYAVPLERPRLEVEYSVDVADAGTDAGAEGDGGASSADAGGEPPAAVPGLYGVGCGCGTAPRGALLPMLMVLIARQLLRRSTSRDC